MKSYNNLYPQIYDFENLYRAYLKARRCKRYRKEVLEFSTSLEENLLEIQNELIWKSYRTGKYRQFYVYEPKERLVLALPFKDRIVHHALCNVIEPIFDKTFIYDSYACRLGKGTHAGVERLTYFLRRAKRIWDNTYCLKCDIAQYFPSINHRILLGLYRKKIRCKDTMWLISEIINSTADPNDPDPRGVPIGNLTSQLSANVYLNELDHFIKEILRVRFYVRYMDDFIILHGRKRVLRWVVEEITGFLDRHLKLQLNSKTAIFPISQGINFLGYKIWATHRLLRKDSIKRIKRKLKRYQEKYAKGLIGLEEIKASLASWLGHCLHCNSYNLRKKILKNFVLRRES